MPKIDTAGAYALGDRSVKRLGYGAMQLAGPGMFTSHLSFTYREHYDFRIYTLVTRIFVTKTRFFPSWTPEKTVTNNGFPRRPGI